MAKNIIIVGTQWGDEGKGKIVDLLTEKADAVAFFDHTEAVGHAFAKMFTEDLALPFDGEFVSEKCCEVGCEAYGLDFPKGAMAVTQSIGKTKEEALQNAKDLVEFFKSAGATESFVLEDEEIREQVWGVRENAMRWG